MDGRFEKAKRPSRFTRSPASEIFHGLEQNACSNPKKAFRTDIHKQAVSLALFPTWQVVLPISVSRAVFFRISNKLIDSTHPIFESPLNHSSHTKLYMYGPPN
jgi:hypothetical protein